MADSKLDLPGKWDAAKRYLIKGSTLIAWAKNLQADRALPGPGLTENQTPEGRILSVASVSGTAVPTGAFFGMALDGDGNTLLQGGMVTAGSGSHAFLDIAVLEPGPSVGDLAGNFLWLEITGNGVVADGVLLPGFNLTTAATGIGTAVPDNTLPTAAGASGKTCHVLLGQWSETTFHPSGVGNIQISFCPGSYTVTRY